MTFNGRGDICGSYFGDVWDSGALVFPPHARVLEVGCAEYDWMTPMLELRPDLDIVGIDWRPCSRPGVVVQGNVLTVEFPEASFDAVVGISSFEHIGLGHYDGDPVDVDGDTHCLQRCARWLKPGGWVYGDVPYHPEYAVRGTEYRAYNEGALKRRLLEPAGLVHAGRWGWAMPHELPILAFLATKPV